MKVIELLLYDIILTSLKVYLTIFLHSVPTSRKTVYISNKKDQLLNVGYSRNHANI
jgi:hypothetical protein